MESRPILIVQNQTSLYYLKLDLIRESSILTTVVQNIALSLKSALKWWELEHVAVGANVCMLTWWELKAAWRNRHTRYSRGSCPYGEVVGIGKQHGGMNRDTMKHAHP
jgi:hypothetical protein